jgi:Aldo/keto reductase family
MAVISIRVYQVPVSLQALYSLATRQTELEMRPAALHNELGILAWSPLASGFLTGKYERNEPRSPGARAGHDRPLYQYTSSNYETSDRTWAAVDAVRQVAVSDPNPNPLPLRAIRLNSAPPHGQRPGGPRRTRTGPRQRRSRWNTPGSVILG